MSDVRHEPLFPATLEVVSTKHPASGAPLVGLVMAQRIATLGSREAVRDHIARVEAAADAAFANSNWVEATALEPVKFGPGEVTVGNCQCRTCSDAYAALHPLTPALDAPKASG